MAIRKVYKPDIKANQDSTKIENIFFDIPKDTTVQVRVLPITEESGLVFTKAVNHFKMVGENGRKAALACLHVHGTEETGDTCFLCKLSRVLLKNGDKAEKEIGNDISASPRWYCQVMIAENIGENEDGTFKFAYKGPRLLGLPKTGVEGVNTILNNMGMARQPDFTDPDQGQDLLITRHSKTPWYTVDRTGVMQSLADIFPEWETKMVDSIAGEMNLKIETAEEQKASAVRAFGKELDWEALAEKFGL